jgi:hypothetical protein
MKIMKGKKAFLWKTVAALVILALCAVPVLASFPTYADDGADGAPPPVVDTPVIDGAPPVVDSAPPVVDTPVVDGAPPVVDTPVVDAVTEETATTQETTGDEAVTEETATQETTGDEAVTEETATQETTGDEAVTEETAITDETTSDEAVIEETITDETTSDEAVTEETATTDEATSDEAVTEETATTEETTGDEAVTEETATTEETTGDEAVTEETATTEEDSTVLTDKPDYAPEEAPVIYGEGFAANSPLTITVTAPDGTVTTLTTTADEQGGFGVVFEGGLMKGEYSVTVTDGTTTASSTFLDADILYPTDDSWVTTADRDDPWDGWSWFWGTEEDNRGEQDTLHTKVDVTKHWGNYEVDDVRRTYLMFDLNGVPDGATINSATVWMHQKGGGGGSLAEVPKAYLGANNSWDELTLTWDNQPGGSGGGVTTDTIPPASSFSWTVTGFVDTALATVDKLLTLVFAMDPETAPPNTDRHHDFFSKDASASNQWPFLSIDWTAAPPSDTTPPVLEKTLTDPDGATSPTGNFDPAIAATWWITAPITVELSATDAPPGSVASIKYSFDGITWYTYTGPTGTGPFDISSQGLNALYHIAFDNAGNQSTEISPYQEVWIDTGAPTLTKGLYTQDGAGNWVLTQDPNGLNGWYTSNVQVRLTGGDTTSGLAKVEYSFDGTTWLPYSDPFTLPGDGTIHLYHQAFDKAGNQYTLSDQFIKIDQIPPTLVKGLYTPDGLGGWVVTPAPNGLNGWYTSDVQVRLTGGDTTSGLAKVEYSYDGTNWLTYSDPFELLGDGTIHLYHQAFDNAGNQFVLTDQYIKIDQTDPTLTKGLYIPDGNGGWNLSGPNGLNDWYTSNVQVRFTADDATSGLDRVEYSYDGTNWLTYSDPFELLGDGTIHLYHQAFDNAGNQFVLTDQYIKIDQTPPTLEKGLYTQNRRGKWVLSDPNGLNGWYTSDVQVKLTGGDTTSGLAKVEYSYDGTNWLTYNDPFELPGDGTIHLYHQAFDNAGNQFVLTDQYIKIDQIPPTLTKGLYIPDGNGGWDLSGPNGNEGWYTSPVFVVLDAHDETSGVDKIQYKTGLFGWNTASATVVGDQGPEDFETDFTLSKEGRITLYHRAYDVAGNKGTEPVGASQEVKIDYSDPKLYKIECGEEGDNGWYISPVNVTLTATDFTSIWKLFDNSGINYIQYQIDGGSLNQDYGPRLPLASDQGWPAWLTNFTVSTEGTQTLEHKAFDVAGNDSNDGSDCLDPWNEYRVGDSQQLKIDLTDPDLVKALSGIVGNNDWWRSPVLVTLTATDTIPGSGIYEIRYTVDGTEYVVSVPFEGTSQLVEPFTLSNDDIYDLTHQTRDYAGRTFTLDPQQVKIDQTAPDLTKDLRLTQLNEVTVTLTGTDITSGVDSIQYSTDGGNTWTTVPCNRGLNDTTTFTLTGIGDHELGHLVFDVAGNQYVLPDQIVSIAGGGTTVMPTTLVITVDVMGTVASYEVSPDGTLLEDALTTSPDGKVRLFIPAGTRLLNADGTTPTYTNNDPDIVIKPAGTPPTPPGYQMVAVYELLPSGVTFSKDANLIVEYDPEKLPADSTPIIAYYNETAGEWEPLETAGYVAGGIEQPNTITSHIGHLSYYAVLAKIATAE